MIPTKDINNISIAKEFDAKKGKALLDKRHIYSMNLHFFLAPEKFAKEKTKDALERVTYRNLVWEYNLGDFNFQIKGDPLKGLPHGLLARLIINWIDQEILYNCATLSDDELKGGYKLNWNETKTQFCKQRLGLSGCGINIKELDEQFEKLSKTRFDIQVPGPNGILEEFPIPFIIDSYFAWKHDGGTRTLFKSWILIHPAYIKYVKLRRFVLDTKIVRKFIRIYEGYDIYKYIKYTCNTTRFPKTDPVSEIQRKLGNSEDRKNFTKKLKKILKIIKENDQTLNFEIKKGKNRYESAQLIIYPSKKKSKQKIETKPITKEEIQERIERLSLLADHYERTERTDDLMKLKNEIQELQNYQGSLN